MLKVTVLVLFSLATIVASVNLNKYAYSLSVTENQIKETYDDYIRIAPYFVKDTPQRYSYFRDQLVSIMTHNSDSQRTWNREVNLYTGMFLNELSGNVIMDTQVCANTPSFDVPLAKLFDYPTSFDWRDLGMVSPVKNQGNFGACWAFASTGAIESHWAIYTNSTPSLLSEQQLIDCAANNNSSDGLPSSAFEYVTAAGGIETENTYPYIMQQENCVFNASVSGALVGAGSVNITAGDEASMLYALVQHGPIATLLDITDDFTSYTGGIYSSESCGKTPQNVNHAVLIIGYGTDSATGTDYWIAKNSWGRGWGEEGYFRIERGVNMCGIADCASFPNMTMTQTIYV